MKKLGIIYAPRLSASAAALASAVPLFRFDDHGFRSPAGKRASKVINWGSKVMDTCFVGRPTLNQPQAVQKALSKLRTLTILKDASVPALEATGDVNVAKQWASEGLVLCRRDGLSGGAGIAKATTPQEVVASDMYVRYWKKTHEYRVHVFKGVVIDIQQKRRRTEWNGTYDPMIRNFDNGWVFCHDNLKGTAEELSAIGTTATTAVTALGLDFGAVDILARFKESGSLSKHVVCEINTAPGLEGQTLDKYVQAIRSYLSGV